MTDKRAAVVSANKPQRGSESSAAFIEYGKRRLSAALRAGHVSESTKAKMRLAAVKHPGLFSAWATV